SVPLHTVRASIDYGAAEAHTMAGKVGIKVWICVKPEQESDVKAGVQRAGNA
ncbi:MAG: 30S ribosomal protein S3, partial [Verrucomicrobiota bacterium]